MSSDNIKCPHDRFFRSMMTEPKVIKEFFAQNLPENIRNVINFDTIELQKESFIDDKLKLKIADILYSVEFINQPGSLYILVEHQSTPEKLMPFRILKYMVSIMEQHLNKTKTHQLPTIYPIIFYTGQKPYNYSLDLSNLWQNQKELKNCISFEPCKLIDLSKILDEKLRSYPIYGPFAYAMKHIYQKDFLPILKIIMNDLRSIEKQINSSYINRTLSYILEAGEMEEQCFINAVKTELLNTNCGVKIMTIAEQLVQKGKLEGKIEAFSIVATKLFKQGMDINKIATITELPIQKINSLKKSQTKK
jgi:predicted transposase/invertase (TIGR01784 family)